MSLTSLVLHSVRVKNTFIEGYCDNAPSSEDDDETRLSDGSFVPRLVRSTSEPDMMTIKLMEQSTSPSPLTSQTMGDLPLYQPDEEFDEDSEQASCDSEFSRQVSSTIGDKGPTNGWTISMDSTEPSTSGEKSPCLESDNGGLGNGGNHSPHSSANGDAEKQGYWVMPAKSALMAHCAWMADGPQIHGPSHSKVVSVVPATVQGYDANYAHYSNSRLRQLDPAATQPLSLREAKCGKSRQGRGQKPMSMINIAAAKNLQLQQVRHPKQPEVNAKAPKVAEATPSLSMPRVPRFCPYCGAPSRSDFKFCGYCGAGLDH